MKQLVLLLLVFAVFALAFCVFYYSRKAWFDDYVREKKNILKIYGAFFIICLFAGGGLYRFLLGVFGLA